MSKPQRSESGFFPIRVLSELTGVGTSTLRAWERRYGLLNPERTPKGHRLYTNADVRLVERALEQLRDGHSIRDVARRLVSNRPWQRPQRPDSGVDSTDDGRGPWDRLQSEMVAAVEAFSPRRLDAVYNEASSIYPLDLVSGRLIEPVLMELGVRWKSGAAGIAEEHFFSAWLRNKLGARLHHASAQASGPALVAACVPGYRHEIGLLLFMLAALGHGYRMVYLGVDMPLEPLPEVVARCGAEGVVLAGGLEPHPDDTVVALAALVGRLPCPLFVGGALSVESGQALNRAGAFPIGERFDLALHLVDSRLSSGRSRDARSSRRPG